MKNLSMLQIDTIEVRLIEELGTFNFLDNVLRALDYSTKEDIYLYIARMHDIDIEDIEKWEND